MELRASLTSINDDVLHEICNAVRSTNLDFNNTKPTSHKNPIKSLSQTNWRMRDFITPRLFKDVYVNNATPNKTLDIVNSIIICRAVESYTERFLFRFRDSHAAFHLLPPRQLPSKLDKILCSMSKLYRIRLEIPTDHLAPYRETFSETKLRLPTVRELVLGPCLGWFVDVCPNVTHIATTKFWLNSEGRNGKRTPRQHSHDLMAAAGRASSLRHFEMCEGWNHELLETLEKALPHASSLALTGKLSHMHVKTFIVRLSKFARLETLTTPPLQWLRTSFNPPQCGNAYRGEAGKRLRKMVDQERRRRNYEVAVKLFSACPQLEIAWIGDHYSCLRCKQRRLKFNEGEEQRAACTTHRSHCEYPSETRHMWPATNEPSTSASMSTGQHYRIEDSFQMAPIPTNNGSGQQYFVEEVEDARRLSLSSWCNG